ncbi:LpxL/LpxP family acyltransferase, partial [Mycobacterium kansasii]
ESYGRYWREVFRLPTMNHRKLARQLDRVIGGLDHLDAALAAGLGAVLALAPNRPRDIGGIWLVQPHPTRTTRPHRHK